MNYTDQEIAHQLGLGEDSQWEFKQIEFSGNRAKSPSRNDWADEIAAFANTDGGVLLCGVSDAGVIQGMSRETDGRTGSAFGGHLHRCDQTAHSPNYPATDH